MQNNITILTKESDLQIVYGMYDLGPEREAARGSVKYILIDLNDIRKSFIKLGFHLSEMLNNKYYEDFGYLNIEDFAEKNLGMDKSNVYKYIRVYEIFSQQSDRYINGVKTGPCRMEIDDRWKEYSISQLVEMCNMSDDQRQNCKPEMTIKQIREIKKNKQSAEKSGDVATPYDSVKNNFEYNKFITLHGAAQSSYIKKCEPVESAVINIYDKDGKRVPLGSSITNVWIDLLSKRDNHYYFRLNRSIEELGIKEEG